MDRNDLDFVGIKLGDVTGDVNPLDANNQADFRNEEFVFFMLENKQLKVGEEVTVPFVTKYFQNLNGYQVSLKFDSNALELKNALSNSINGFPKENFGDNRKNKGELLLNWVAEETSSLTDGTELFSLVFKVKKSTTLKEVLEISDAHLLSEAYDINDDFLKIGLNFIDENNDQLFDLTTYPNPFIHQTTFSFYASQNRDAILEFYNSNGQLIKTIASQFSEGENKINVDFQDINSRGIIFYQIKTDNGKWSGKLIKQ